MSRKKSQSLTIRSSAAEYLTFVAVGGDSESSVEMRYENENIRLTQKMMASLYDVSVSAINQHLKRIFADNELEREATIKKYLIVQTEGNRQVQREVEHYNLQAIIADGFDKLSHLSASSLSLSTSSLSLSTSSLSLSTSSLSLSTSSLSLSTSSLSLSTSSLSLSTSSLSLSTSSLSLSKGTGMKV